jgi:hypothetical protein
MVYSPVFYDDDQNEGLISVQNGASANGSGPELQFQYGPWETRYYDYRAVTPAINTTGAISLALSFKHYYDFYEPDVPNSIAVEVSTDNGGTWVPTSWVISPTTADVGPEVVEINLNAYAGQTILISWRWYEYTYWGDYWYIDDIAVTGVTALIGIGPISGTPEVGQTLTVGNLTPPGATATYQWQSCATVNGTYDDISGATSSTYDLIPADKDQYIRVSATGYGDYAGTVTSEPVLITGLPLHAVTFNETNSLSGVNIDIYDDIGGYLDYVTTNETGQATIDLADGNYTYFAGKIGYAPINDEEFVVSGSAQTINFTMSLAYTVTFDEANDLPFVYIEVYNSSEDKMAELDTDASGNATIGLPNDTYDFYAYIDGYMDLEGNFTVTGEPLTVPFEMIPCPFVTFNETNGLPDVYIKVYEESALRDYVDDLLTDSSGQAGITICKAGTYYYEAMRSGNATLVGDFAVSVSNITESFTMETGYYVDFTEVNSEMAILQLFSDSGLTIAASSPFVTDEYGNATIELANGSYYYRATRTGFNDCTGDFTVSSEPLSVPFDIVPTPGVIFAEDFTRVDYGSLPYGWTTNASSPCHVTDSNSAGGYAPELALVWTGGGRLIATIT